MNYQTLPCFAGKNKTASAVVTGALRLKDQLGLGTAKLHNVVTRLL